MKYVFFILVFVFLLGHVSAIESDIKSTYQPKETMIIKLSGAISGNINDNQVFVKRNNIFVPVEYDVARVGNNWYVWILAPSSQNNYTLIIEDIQVQSGQGTISETYQKNFAVEGQTKSYNIKPGFVVTDKDFNIELEVLDNQNHDIEVSFPIDEIITVQPGTTNIAFSIDSVTNTGLKEIMIGDYIVPAYITVYGTTPSVKTNTSNQNSSQNNSSNQTNFVQNTKISIYPSYVQQYLYKNNEERKYEFSLVNENNLSHKKLQIKFNSTLFDVDDDSFDLKPNANYSFELTLKKNAPTNVSENIIITGENVSLEIPFIIRFSDNATSVASFYSNEIVNGSNGTIRRTSYLCSELGGIVCSSNSICGGENIEGKDGQCCLGICRAPEGSSYAWIGWLIAFLVLGIAWFAYYKYKKAGTDSFGPQ